MVLAAPCRLLPVDVLVAASADVDGCLFEGDVAVPLLGFADEETCLEGVTLSS